jgi:hypothetical protein
VDLQAVNRGMDLFPVPDPRGVLTADTLDEATSLVRAAICPHWQVNEPPRKSVVYLSSLDLGGCGLTNLKYGFDVDIDAIRIRRRKLKPVRAPARESDFPSRS